MELCADLNIKNASIEENVPNTIRPGASFSFVADYSDTFRLREHDPVNIYSDSLNLYLFGKMTYKDIFGDPHYIHYSVKMIPSLHACEFTGGFNDGD